MKIHKDLIQGSPEWMYAKLGKPSASNFGRVMDSYSEPEYYVDNAVNQKKGIAGTLKNTPGFGDGAKTYAIELIAETLLNEPTFTHVNYAMEHGNEYEPYAREIYERDNKLPVIQVGGIESDGLWYSPDGLVGDDGLIEIKCPQPTNHIRFLLDGEIDKKYITQMQFGLMVSGRKWCDFISFHPDFPDALKIKAVRIYPDLEYHYEMKLRADEFKKLILTINNKLCH